MIFIMKKILIIPVLSLCFAVSPVAAQSFAEEEANPYAPVIVQPKLSSEGQEKLNSGFFSGLGRIFRPKTEDTQTRRSGTRRPAGSTSTRQKGESHEAFSRRYMEERAERLRQRTVRDDSAVMTRDNNPYQLMMRKAHNPLTHYQGKDGKIHKRAAAIDEDILKKVQNSVKQYAAQRNTSVAELMKNPAFEKQVEALYSKTLTETRAAEKRAAAEAKMRAQAEAKRRGEEQKRLEREQRQRERDQERENR